MKAVIFDMDGVIVDSEPRHERAFLHVLNVIGIGDGHGMEFSDYIVRADREIWEEFLARHKPEQTIEELLAMKREHFGEPNSRLLRGAEGRAWQLGREPPLASG